jgi:hypothetical protein
LPHALDHGAASEGDRGDRGGDHPGSPGGGEFAAT